MRKLSSYLTNYEAASTGFSEGKLQDDDGSDNGSGIVVATHNDGYYADVAEIIKYKGALSDTAESESASDVRDSHERMCGVQNENVDEYDSTETYSQDDHAMYLGIQFVSMVDTNTGNAPFDYPDKWLPCYERNDAVRMWRDGVDIDGGFAGVHNKRDTTNYREYFEWGKYNFGGNAGRNFKAYGIHLDGQILTGDTTYETIFAIGLTGEYHLLDVIAPEVLSVRTMMDSKGRVPRIVDETDGDSEDVGGVQEDQMQLLTGIISANIISSNSSAPGFTGVFDDSTSSQVDQNFSSGSLDYAVVPDFNSANSPDAKTSDDTDGETRVKSYTVGLKLILVLNEIV